MLIFYNFGYILYATVQFCSSDSVSSAVFIGQSQYRG